MRTGFAVFALLLALPAATEEIHDLSSAIAAGDAGLDLRYRFETVDQDGFDDDARASTARLRFNFRTAQWNGWSAFGEFDHVFTVLFNDFNSGAGTSPGKAGVYPVVADPNGSDLNQLYIQYDNDDWQWRLGRQRILLDNQRFVGGVGWRQNEQTYDGLSLTTTAVGKTRIFYSYVGQVRRIFGQEVSAGSNDVDTHLFNARFGLRDDWSVTPYVYYIDNDDVPAFSTATAGARLAGEFAAGTGKFSLLAELATQSDAADAPVSYDADYLHVAATWSGDSGIAVGAGLESLGGSQAPGEAFRTPLATLHGFNGWADKFLTTPDGGLEDTYLTLKYKSRRWNFAAVYHTFGAETGGGDYGTEMDISAARKLSERYGLLLKGALFSAESGSSFTDTDKFWVMVTASY